MPRTQSKHVDQAPEPATPAVPNLLTVEWIAGDTGVDQATVWRWIKRGLLGKTVKLGRRITRIRRENYAAFLKSREA